MNRAVEVRHHLVSRQTNGGRLALSLAGAALLLMVSMPWWADAGLTRSVVEFSCYLALAAMWNLLAGYAGMVSIGQQAFLGVAAYGLFALAGHFDVDPFLAAGLCLVVPVLLAVPTYLLLRRLEGPYFAIGTWVIAEVCRLVISNTEWLGSSSGMTLRAMQQYSLEQRQMGVVWMAAIMLLLTVGGSYWLLRSRFGLALTAMRDNAVSATSQGVDVERLRFLVFLAAAIGTGLVGAVYYLSALRLSPNAGFDPNWIAIAIFIVMVGGIGTLEGPLLGAAVYFTADRLFSDYGVTYLIALGLLTLVVALYARGGLWSITGGRLGWHWFPTRWWLRSGR
ncbi:MAG: branched-chain amino acid ABC transporter permease [Hydrogenophaga sp.]|nr:branched-chain amino acid ABC transporter permease [Hydrogenophaga sp.]